MAAKPDQVATPLERSSGGKAAVIVDSVPGMIIAAPRPMTARQTISVLVESAHEAARDAVPKTTVPTISTLRRPRRSPIAPSGSTRAARATV